MESDWLSDWSIFTGLVKDAENDVMLACLCVRVRVRGGSVVEMKPELQRVLESRKRDQLIKQRKQEVEAHRKISPLEAELLKRHKKLEEVRRAHTHTHTETHSESLM